jgi:hypothetical protein
LAAGIGFAYTPVDERDRLLSVQMGLAAEVHDPDVIGGAYLVSGECASRRCEVGGFTAP